jgi:hypothetical protein
MGLQEFPSKPVNKGGVVIGTINGPTEVAIGAQDSYLVADSTQTSGAKWQTYRKYNTVQLTSGTSWTVPATVEMVDVLLIGGGSGGTTRTASGTAGAFTSTSIGPGGAFIYVPNFAVTPGAAIAYSIGAGSNAPAASGSVDVTTYPSAAGNTTFSTLTAPGAMNKLGNYNAWTIGTQTGRRGVIDALVMDGSGTSNASDLYASTNIWSTLGFPIGSPGVIASYARATSSSAATNSSSPAISIGDAIGANTFGITPGYFKLLEGYTGPQGGLATNELATNTAVTRVLGWAGFGGGSSSTTGTIYSINTAGSGQGVILNSANTAGRGSTGGHAAANSGAGGGGARACSSGASPVQAAVGGNGGSGCKCNYC